MERHGGSKRESARLFGVQESFLYKLLRQKRERGALAPFPPGGGAQAKLTAENGQQVASGSAATPAAPLAELQEQGQRKLRVRGGVSTGWRGVERLGGTRKNRVSGPPKRMRRPGPPFRSRRRSGPGTT